jgi:hypothetical protein
MNNSQIPQLLLKFLEVSIVEDLHHIRYLHNNRIILLNKAGGFTFKMSWWQLLFPIDIINYAFFKCLSTLLVLLLLFSYGILYFIIGSNFGFHLLSGLMLYCRRFV